MASGEMTANALRAKTDAELVEELGKAKDTLFHLRFQAATGQLESHGRLKAVRKDIARIYTILRERELGITPVFEDGGVDGGEDAGAEGTSDASPAEVTST